MLEINHESLTDKIYQVLKDNIERQELPSGSRLIENDIAQKLNVSRTPVREAISRLSSEGLVTNIPRRGAFVADLSRKTIKEIYEIREGLESLAINLMSSHVSDQEIDILRDYNNQFAKALDQDDYMVYLELDRKYHESIIEFSKNEKLLELYRVIDGSIHLTRWLHCENDKISKVALLEHTQIVDALYKRDIQLALHLIQNHIRRVKEELLETVSDQSQPNVK